MTDDQHVAVVTASIEKAGGMPSYFCDGWPIAKKIAKALAKHLPSWAKPIVGFLVAVGDAVYAKECAV